MVKEVQIYLKQEKREAVLRLSDEASQVRAFLEQGKPAALVLTQENAGEEFGSIRYAVEAWEALDEKSAERIYRRLAKLPIYILETDRCVVREMEEEDLDALYQIYEPESVSRYMENLYEDREKERQYIRDYKKYVYAFYEYGMWIIEEKTTGEIIGRAGIDPKDEENELGYVIGVPWQNQGYAYEVCGAILEYAEKELGLSEIISRVQPDNKISIRLLHKLGFQKERTATDEKDGMDTYRIILPATAR